MQIYISTMGEYESNFSSLWKEGKKSTCYNSQKLHITLNKFPPPLFFLI